MEPSTETCLPLVYIILVSCLWQASSETNYKITENIYVPDDPYKLTGKTIYNIITEKADWFAADATCKNVYQNFGGSLAKIDSSYTITSLDAQVDGEKWIALRWSNEADTKPTWHDVSCREMNNEQDYSIFKDGDEIRNENEHCYVVKNNQLQIKDCESEKDFFVCQYQDPQSSCPLVTHPFEKANARFISVPHVGADAEFCIQGCHNISGCFMTSLGTDTCLMGIADRQGQTFVKPRCMEVKQTISGVTVQSATATAGACTTVDTSGLETSGDSPDGFGPGAACSTVTTTSTETSTSIRTALEIETVTQTSTLACTETFTTSIIATSTESCTNVFTSVSIQPTTTTETVTATQTEIETSTAQCSGTVVVENSCSVTMETLTQIQTVISTLGGVLGGCSTSTVTSESTITTTVTGDVTISSCPTLASSALTVTETSTTTETVLSTIAPSAVVSTVTNCANTVTDFTTVLQDITTTLISECETSVLPSLLDPVSTIPTDPMGYASDLVITSDEKQQLSSFRRKKQSASDERTSAQVSGLGAIIFISIVLALCVIVDVPVFFQHVKNGLIYNDKI